MRFITTLVHGMFDYLSGILLIASPWLFDFARGGAETLIPMILGAGLILYSLFTNYELGKVKRLAMSTHLWLDIVSGAFLAVSPWLFNFDEYVYMPHLIFGIAEVIAGLMTKTVPEIGHRYDTHSGSTKGTASVSAPITTTQVNSKRATTTDRPAMGSGADAGTLAERARTKRGY